MPTPSVLRSDSPWQQYRDVKGPACMLHWGDQTQRWADRLLSACEEYKAPDQRVYMFVLSDEQAAELVDSCFFGCPPPFKTLRGYAQRYDVIDADGIAIVESVLRDGAERELFKHELGHHAGDGYHK